MTDEAARGDDEARVWRPDDLNRPGPAYLEVAEQLRAAILNGELQPGERLPGEAQLAQSFGVSRGTVREALRTLCSQELVATTRGVTGGTTVQHPSPKRYETILGDAFRVLAVSNLLPLDSVIEARMIFEVPAAGLAAARHTEEDLAVLRERVDLHGPDNVAQTQGFHSALVKATGSVILELMAGPLFDALDVRSDRTTSVSSETYDEVHDDHLAIFRAVEARDSETAEALMRDHLERLRVIYRETDRGSDQISSG